MLAAGHPDLRDVSCEPCIWNNIWERHVYECQVCYGLQVSTNLSSLPGYENQVLYEYQIVVATNLKYPTNIVLLATNIKSYFL